MYSDNLSDELRMAVQPMTKFRQFCDVKDATQQGKKKGDTFLWDVYQDVATPAGSTLTETNTMPETNFTITQGTLTITEAGNSVPYSGKLDDLSQHPVKTIINKVLKNDASKWFDGAAATQFNATPLRVAGTSSTSITLSTAGTCTATNSQAMNTGHVKLIVDTMKERNIPAYTGDDYYCLAWPTTYRFFKNQLETIHTYTDAGFQMIMNGEIGRYENVRYIEQTNIPKGGAADSTTWNAFTRTADAWNGGYSDWAYFFGADTVAEAIACPEEMRGKIPTDYGRSKGVAWYYLGGFGIVHPLNAATSSSNARVIKWDSAV
jgi:N4-gp56 family major capsid protein